jgi:hypothetical protein
VNFTDNERDSLVATRSLSRDDQGRDVLVGLTERETKRYMDYVRRGGSRLKAEREMHKQLDQKPVRAFRGDWDRARSAFLAVEAQACAPRPLKPEC